MRSRATAFDRKGFACGLRTVWAWDSYGQIKRAAGTRKTRHRALPQHLSADLSGRLLRLPRGGRAGNTVAAQLPAALSRRNFSRDGRVCEDCLGRKFAWRGVLHGCYRDSRAADGVVTALCSASIAGWRPGERLVDCYIVLTEFCAAPNLSRAGLPAEKIVVKPHFVYPDPMASIINHDRRSQVPTGSALFRWPAGA